MLFTAGITARDEAGAVVGVDDMRAQIETCFANLGMFSAKWMRRSTTS